MDLEREVREFLKENFILDGETVLRGDASLTDSGVMDSLGVLELIMFIEEKWDIQVADSEAVPSNLDTIDNIVRYLDFKIKESVTPGVGNAKRAI